MKIIIIKNIENDFVSIESENINVNKDNISMDDYRIKKIKNYKSESSFAKIKVNKPKCIFAFKSDDIVIIVTPDEKVCFSKIEKKGGYCILTKEKELKK